MKLLVRHKLVIHYESVSLITRKWREYFSLSYHSKEGRWPNVTEESLHDNYISIYLLHNIPIDKGHPEYSLKPWDLVEFMKTFDVPDKFEFSGLIADKCTSIKHNKLTVAL